MPRPFVIVAEDDEGWRELLTRWLSAEDYCELKMCSRGRDVLPAAAKRRPDLFILDHQLGDTTGMAVCAKLKADARLGAVPVIILTTMAGEMLKIVDKAKPDHFVVKTGTPDELLEVMEALLSRP
ncbi:MAG: response regulator [Elusimicrobia bacterium]|nr:response regulator [Elusimicrobiota bacterium]